MFNKEKLKKQKKLIIRRINLVIKDLQNAKKSAISGSADIDNYLNDARIKIKTIHEYVRGEFW